MNQKMLRVWLLLGIALLAACGRAREPEGTQEEAPAKTPLQKVEKILTGETPPVDPVVADPVPPDPDKPAVPVAKPVPDKPGFVISPYNGKWIDVTGVAPGELMLDPHFPAEEKKYFRVPESFKPPAMVVEKPAEPVLNGSLTPE